MTDEELNKWIDQLILGDQSAFEVIYGMTRKKIYGTVAAMVANKEDVNEIVNEVYYQLWRALPSYDRKRPFLFWLNGIVMKQVNNWRRQIWRRFRLQEKKTRLSEEPQVETPDERMLESESHGEMKELINQMPFKLRIVIVYRFYYEFSHEEIAELLQIPVGTVKSRMHLAFKHLRKRLGTELDGEVFSDYVYIKKNESGINRTV
ncbi:sigma-70 family RNA polymerase sigma factor [Paenibacillus eucommiae]|uniref:RNA polymerase sigma-70 factor (ECF subfamily) n=1 Tax=Paenibacillus eucommiae TaxID=1355755 RepID=A0ABS4ISQ7_9BACL|nr:sigma-70 family RNA polymerase sigma factor [Paenibacillus eucommiae]MBP1990607.1 RNA polymerase sigma-70 factor (ECF subfamily) [Paenibacillus eucommiae]